MDHFDRERYATVYRLLAEIMERERGPAGEEEDLSYLLGDLTRRVFVGTGYDPPADLLEVTAETLRTGDEGALKKMASRLRRHAEHLDELDAQS